MNDGLWSMVDEGSKLRFLKSWGRVRLKELTAHICKAFPVGTVALKSIRKREAGLAVSDFRQRNITGTRGSISIHRNDNDRSRHG